MLRVGNIEVAVDDPISVEILDGWLLFTLFCFECKIPFAPTNVYQLPKKSKPLGSGWLNFSNSIMDSKF